MGWNLFCREVRCTFEAENGGKCQFTQEQWRRQCTEVGQIWKTCLIHQVDYLCLSLSLSTRISEWFQTWFTPASIIRLIVYCFFIIYMTKNIALSPSLTIPPATFYLLNFFYFLKFVVIDLYMYKPTTKVQTVYFYCNFSCHLIKGMEKHIILYSHIS